jgi:hypothetical protein
LASGTAGVSSAGRCYFVRAIMPLVRSAEGVMPAARALYA